MIINENELENMVSSLCKIFDRPCCIDCEVWDFGNDKGTQIGYHVYVEDYGFSHKFKTFDELKLYVEKVVKEYKWIE